MKVIGFLFSWVMSLVAVYLSWTLNHSVLWAIFHFFVGALYVGFRIAGWPGVFGILFVILLRQILIQTLKERYE
jgi:hypothetical protein